MCRVIDCKNPTNSSYLAESAVWAVLAIMVAGVACYFFHAQDVVTVAAWLGGVQLSIVAGTCGVMAVYKIYLAYRTEPNSKSL